jgi:DNA-binding response OmpR family regulator
MSLVLLIDDEPALAQLVSMVLDGLDVRLVQAHSPAEAAAELEKEKPDVILLDIALGDEDGLALLPRLKTAGDGHTKVIVLSVHDSRRREALDLGADAFVAKPFRPGELRATLEAFLKDERS